MDRLKILEEKYNEGDKSVFILYALTMEYINKNEYEKAIFLFSEMKCIYSDYLPMYYQAAILNINIENYGQARKWISEGIVLAKLKQDAKTESELRALMIHFENEE